MADTQQVSSGQALCLRAMRRKLDLDHLPQTTAAEQNHSTTQTMAYQQLSKGQEVYLEVA